MSSPLGAPRVNATELQIPFRALNTAMVPAVNAFLVTVDDFPYVVSSIVLSNFIATLTLDTAVKFRDVLYVEYTPPNANALQLVGGLDIVAFRAKATNKTADPELAEILIACEATVEDFAPDAPQSTKDEAVRRYYGYLRESRAQDTHSRVAVGGTPLTGEPQRRLRNAFSTCGARELLESHRLQTAIALDAD